MFVDSSIGPHSLLSDAEKTQDGRTRPERSRQLTTKISAGLAKKLAQPAPSPRFSLLQAARASSSGVTHPFRRHVRCGTTPRGAGIPFAMALDP